jgi:hypothetical protein
MEACLEERPQYIELMDHQKEALQFLANGKILYGGVGSGKSAVAIAYYMEKEAPRELIVITTAKKRDSLDWEGEAARAGISVSPDFTCAGVLTVDSWNNITKYLDTEDAFFVFDEQRLVGHGAWVKSFLKIAKKNRWILLSATPGDVWLDYAPVFIANGWYKNITDFKRKHVLYAPYLKFPMVVGYLGEQHLEKLRNKILVEMPYLKHTERILNFLQVGYDKEAIAAVSKHRWNIFEDRPIKDVAELWRVMRRIVNSDPSRFEAIQFLMRFHPKVIIFYNFDYELEILRWLGDKTFVSEWNGHRKEPVPTCEEWAYLVQYSSGSEGWNCTATNTAILYSLTYSYKNYVQCQGRIDRLNTEFTDLYYYILSSSAYVDTAVKKALENKKSFNEKSVLNTLNYPAFI